MRVSRATRRARLPSSTDGYPPSAHSPEHRLATTAKIAQEVLGAVVDESLPLAACSEVVYDALAVVGMKEMKVSRVPTLVAATCLPQLLTLLLTARLTVFFSLLAGNYS